MSISKRLETMFQGRPAKNSMRDKAERMCREFIGDLNKDEKPRKFAKGGKVHTSGGRHGHHHEGHDNTHIGTHHSRRRSSTACMNEGGQGPDYVDTSTRFKTQPIKNLPFKKGGTSKRKRYDEGGLAVGPTGMTPADLASGTNMSTMLQNQNQGPGVATMKKGGDMKKRKCYAMGGVGKMRHNQKMGRSVKGG